MKRFLGSTMLGAVVLSCGSVSAGELFATGDLLPSEQAAFMKSINDQAAAARRSSGPLKQLEAMMMLEPLAKGECGGFARMEANASDGSADDQYYVGIAFMNGWCVTENTMRGLDWFARAASNDYDQAAVDYARTVLLGPDNGLPFSPEHQKTAVELLKNSAENLNGDANLLLGFMYRDGLTVPMDLSLAEKHFARAAQGANEQAIYALGQLYVTQNDPEKGLDWFLHGANMGYPICQAMSAALLADPIGPQDTVEAYKWANIAAASGADERILNVAQEVRTQLQTILTPEQIADAQARSSSFKVNQFASPPHGVPGEGGHEYSYDELDDPTATPEQIAAREELKAQGIEINRIAFFKAIKEDNLPLVQTFIRAGASLESKAIGANDAPYGTTPIYAAVDWRAEQTYRFLMDQGVNINVAAMETGYTPLVRALAHERYDWAEELLDAGADATMKGDPSMGLITSSALGFAVGTDRIDLVRRILDQGGAVTERYSSEITPLQSAINFGGSTEIIKLLLEKSADPNAIGNYESMTDATVDIEKRTIRMDAFELLLEYGADPEASQRWSGSLMMSAALVGSPRAIKLLIEKGADPNRVVEVPDENIPMLFDDPVQQDIFNSGFTPLAMAAMMGNIGAATTLIEAGADTDFVVKGKTGTYSIRDLADQAGVSIPGV